MAEDTKKVVLKYEADVSSLIKGAQSVETISNRMLKTLGQQGLKVQKILGGAGTSVKKTADVFDKAGGKLKSMGNETTKVATKIKLANGVVGTYTETVKRMTNGTQKVTGAFKQANTATGSFVSRLGTLAKRAVGVVLVWSALRVGMQSLNRLFKSSIKFIIDWEFQLAQVAIVGNTTESQLKTLSGALIQVGKDFGISFKDLGEASKLWRQQGRAMEEIIPLMRTTAKLSLLTGQTTVESVENLTAVLKAYKIEAKDSITIIDSMTNVMLKHAITAGDLSSAYKQVASTASVLGVSFEELSGFITAIKAVTRDSGSKIGLSLRTMFSRITTSSKESIQNLASIPLHLDALGRSTFAVTPRMRNLGDIISELSLKFNSLGNAQKSQLATLIGGVRRQNQVFALFDNFTESVEAQTDAIFGLGKSTDAINILTDTAKIGIDKLKNSWFSFIESISDSTIIKSVINGLAGAINALDKALAPNKAIYKASLDLLNDQSDEYSRQIQLANGVAQVLTKVQRAQEQSVRLSKDQNNVLKEQVKIMIDGVNKALKVQGINASIANSLGLEQTITALEEIDVRMEELRINAQVGQEVARINIEVLSAGQSIGAFRKEFEKVANTRLRLTKIDGLKESVTSLKKIEKGLKISNDEANNLVKTYIKLNKWNKVFGGGLKKNTKEIAEQEELLEDNVEKYIEGNTALEDTAKIRADIVQKEKDGVKSAEDLTIIKKKQDIINRAILKDQLERLKMAGAINSEILIQKKLLQEQLGIEDSLASKIGDQLSLQRELNKEKRLQGGLSAQAIKVFEIAEEHGKRIAKQIDDVLSGAISFEDFERKGGKPLEVFKKEFPGEVKQQKAKEFFRETGEDFNISEKDRSEVNRSHDDSLSDYDRYWKDRIDARKIADRAMLDQARLFEQENAKIRIDAWRNTTSQALATQGVPLGQQIPTLAPQTVIPSLRPQTVVPPIDVSIETNINVNDPKEISDKVMAEVAKQLPQVGSQINKGLAKANFGKQANNN